MNIEDASLVWLALAKITIRLNHLQSSESVLEDLNKTFGSAQCHFFDVTQVTKAQVITICVTIVQSQEAVALEQLESMVKKLTHSDLELSIREIQTQVFSL